MRTQGDQAPTASQVCHVPRAPDMYNLRIVYVLALIAMSGSADLCLVADRACSRGMRRRRVLQPGCSCRRRCTRRGRACRTARTPAGPASRATASWSASSAPSPSPAPWCTAACARANATPCPPAKKLSRFTSFQFGLPVVRR